MFKEFITKVRELISQPGSGLIEDGLDKQFLQNNTKILESIMWPRYRRILYLELIIVPIFILKGLISDCNYNSYPDTISLYSFMISLIIGALFEKVSTKLKLPFDHVFLIKILILFAELTSGIFAAEMEIRLKSDIYYIQSTLQLSFFLIIVQNLKVRVFLIAKFFIHRGIRNQITFFTSGIALHNIFLIFVIFRCLDIQFIQLIKMMHFCQASFKNVPSAVCILSQNCESVVFINSFMNKMVSNNYQDQNIRVDVSESPPVDLAQVKSDIQPVDDARVLDFISHLYVNFEDAKSYLPFLEAKQEKNILEDDLLNNEDLPINLVYLIQQITNSEKQSQKKTYNFQCFFSQDDNICSIQKDESKLKFIIEVRIKTHLQYGNARDAIMVNFLDISTHLKKVYYKKMNQFKSKVIKSISHELRTRLNVIQGMVQILLTDHQLDDKTQKILKTTFNNCRIKKYIIESIINYNLLMENNIPLKKEKCKINDIITDVISLFREEAEAKETKIQFHSDQNDQLQYECDVDKIKSILIHILSNSIRHTKKGEIMIQVHSDLNSSQLVNEHNANLSSMKRSQRITIFKRHGKYSMNFVKQQSFFASKFHSSVTEQYLQIEIKDTGTGIEPENLKIIQEMLLNDDYGNDALSSDGASGVMLGLRASNQIARYLNNTPDNYSCIKIEPNNLQGTTVTLTLKLQADIQQNSLIESEAPIQPIQKMNGLSLTSPYMENQPLVTKTQISYRDINICNCEQDILIVDDEPYNLIVLESLLTKLDQQVIKADDGKQAIEIMVKRFDEGQVHQCKSIKAIIMDYQMPIINGEKAAKQILQICNDRGLAPVPIFGLTGFSGEDDIQRLLQAGMVDVYIKPITMATLEEILSRLQRSEFKQLKSGDLMNFNQNSKKC